MVAEGYSRWTGSVIEVKVLEVSPSGKYVKFRYPNGAEGWVSVESCELVEVLIDEIKERDNHE